MSDEERLSVPAFAGAYPEIYGRTDEGVLREPVVVRKTRGRVSGDFIVDRHNGPGEAGSYVFLGGLEVTGSIINLNGDFGIALIVEGETRAQNIVAGGSFMYLDVAIVPGIVLGHYNDGKLEVRDMQGDLSVSVDHDLELWPRGRRKVSVNDFPSSGREVFVDSIRLPFHRQIETQRTALAGYFRDSPFTNLSDYDPSELEDALLDDDYVIEWMEWALAAIRAGAPASDDTFASFVAHVRKAFLEAASDGSA